jgi:hypothetical protein
MLSIGRITHQLSLVFHPPSLLVVLELGIYTHIIYIFSIATLCEELGINKPTLVLYLCCTLSGASMLGIYTPTPFLYLNSLSCVQALQLNSSFLLSSTLSSVSALGIPIPPPLLYLSVLSCVQTHSIFKYVD